VHLRVAFLDPEGGGGAIPQAAVRISVREIDNRSSMSFSVNDHERERGAAQVLRAFRNATAHVGGGNRVWNSSVATGSQGDAPQGRNTFSVSAYTNRVASALTICPCLRHSYRCDVTIN